MLYGSREENGRIIETIYGRECPTPPIPEDRTAIKGYGDPKAKFKRVEIPEFLRYLDTDMSKWTEKQRTWIFGELHKIYHTGEWQYIHGKLKWISPWMYMLMNYWPAKVDTPDGKVEYRESQRRRLAHHWDVARHPYDIGVLELKKRRTLATNISMMIGYWTATRKKDQFVGMSSMDGKSTEDNFREYLLDVVAELPFWLKPMIATSDKSDRLVFDAPFTRTKSTDIYEKKAVLKSRILTIPPKKKGWDSKKTRLIVNDEIGKIEGFSVYKRHLKELECCTLGPRKIGWIYAPSTIDDEGNGAEGYEELWTKSSNSTKKSANDKTTMSKLVQYFEPAYMAFEGFIDEYGDDIIDTPDDEQWEYMQRTWREFGLEPERIGAKEYLERRRKQFTDNADEVGYLLEIKKFPFNADECFIQTADKCPFNVTILNKLLSIVSQQDFKNKHIRRGYFAWDDPASRSIVKWVSDDKGKIQLTWMPEVPNNVVMGRDGWEPLNADRGLFGYDPYAKANVVNLNKASNASLHGKLFFNYDYEIAHKNNPKHNYYPTYSYFFRMNDRKAIDEDLWEQIIMAIHFYGMPIVVESQHSAGFETYAKARGYDPFLIRKYEAMGIKYPTEAEMAPIGIPMNDDNARAGATYHDMFIRGRGVHLGELTYDITEVPLRYPFEESILDNLKFDMKKRGPHDDTMSQIVTSVAEFGICDFTTDPIHRKIETHVYSMPSNFFD